MNKNKKTSLQEKRVKSQTPYSHQDDSSYSEEISYSRRKSISLNMNRSQTRDNVSLNRNRGRTRDNVPLNRSRSNSPYTHQDNISLNRSRSNSPYAHQDNVSLNRNRSNSPYTHQDNVSLNRNRGRTRDNVPLNRSRSNSPYAHQDNVSLNRNRSNSPYTHQDNVSLNRNRGRTRDNVSLNRSRSNSPYAHQDNVSLNGSRSRSPYSRRGNVSLNGSRSRSPYSHRQVISLSRNRNRSSYASREDVLLNRNRKRTPHSSHRGNYLLNVRDIERERRESNVGEENHGRNKSRERNLEEISELRTAISDLGREVRGLRQEKEDQPRTQHSWSPDPSSTRYTKVRKVLEPMDHEYKKAFRTDIERHVTQDTIPAIKRVLGNKFQYTDIELKKVLQNLHRHRRDAYNVSKDPLKSKVNKRRTGINTRRKDKKERRQRGFRHMLSRRDQKLTDLQPSIPWDDWIEGLEAIINDSSYHSDEISESDEEKVQEEKNRNIRPSRNKNSNHVIHVYDKQWRSSKIRNFLRHADLTGESIQNIKVGRKRWYNDQLYIENNSKPPRNAPAWAISSSYRSE
ncbi:probable serine/threonine-protein kinase clkA [Rhizophagus irregularis DAOM 181602=DAOM 197198]|nr:probable serine/threonine-protein kinase clkA [Rhizophagus irregularis DAOM 181602=DAOM 197198]